MKKSPKIFLTNDDGIHSPGLRAAVQAVMPLGDVIVVAPATQQTGMGRGFAGNMDAPLIPINYEIDGQQLQAFYCEGSPSFVVQHGLNVLFAQQQPDLLISGINYGENLGNNIMFSGTIGAALEGASRGIPTLAVSLQTEKGAYFHYSDQDWAVAAYFLAYFANIVLTHPLPFDVDVLKVDVPSTATTQTPWRVTRLSRTPYYVNSLEHPSLASTPGEALLHINVAQASLEPESDIQALAIDQVVSVTPLSLDCTSRTDFQALHSILTGS
jgi:5'-nucleotidase